MKQLCFLSVLILTSLVPHFAQAQDLEAIQSIDLSERRNQITALDHSLRAHFENLPVSAEEILNRLRAQTTVIQRIQNFNLAMEYDYEQTKKNESSIRSLTPEVSQLLKAKSVDPSSFQESVAALLDQDGSHHSELVAYEEVISGIHALNGDARQTAEDSASQQAYDQKVMQSIRKSGQTDQFGSPLEAQDQASESARLTRHAK